MSRVRRRAHWSITGTEHGTDHMEDTSFVVLYKHSARATAENRASLLCDATAYTRMCLDCVAYADHRKRRSCIVCRVCVAGVA
jgi:hypothetical protein